MNPHRNLNDHLPDLILFHSCLPWLPFSALAILARDFPV
jgi:hypothetical protein